MNFLKLIRVHQYVKNLFIFTPIFFAGEILNYNLFINAFIAFLAFCAAASAIYILNDYRDIEDDRLHPVKKHRPLASGLVSKRLAMIIMGILFLISQALCLLLTPLSFIVLNVYIILNVAYNYGLKHIALIDVTIIAVGFVLRLMIGSVSTGIELSLWIVIMIFLLAMFMALAKRRDDLIIYEQTGVKVRSVVDGYNIKFLDSAVTIMASVTIVAYINYTTSPEVIEKFDTVYLYITAFFVMLGLLRYLQLTQVMNDTGSPTKIALSDRFSQIVILSWFLSFAFAIY